MFKVKFHRNQYKSFSVERGAVLMKALLEVEVPVASSCNGDGICSKCRIRIVAGQDQLSAETELEKSLRLKNKVSDEYRISCQTQVFGDIEIDTDYW